LHQASPGMQQCADRRRSFGLVSSSRGKPIGDEGDRYGWCGGHRRAGGHRGGHRRILRSLAAATPGGAPKHAKLGTRSPRARSFGQGRFRSGPKPHRGQQPQAAPRPVTQAALGPRGNPPEVRRASPTLFRRLGLPCRPFVDWDPGQFEPIGHPRIPAAAMQTPDQVQPGRVNMAAISIQHAVIAHMDREHLP
jgi:hypothetical protein